MDYRRGSLSLWHPLGLYRNIRIHCEELLTSPSINLVCSERRYKKHVAQETHFCIEVKRCFPSMQIRVSLPSCEVETAFEQIGEVQDAG